MTENEKTDLKHWESAWAATPRMRFPSKIDIGIRNIQDLLKQYLRPGIRYIEVGCAPGKILSWVGREIHSLVHGIDYSPTGVRTAKWLCDGLNIKSDIRCEDAIKNSFESESFDLVFSCGLVEHFEDPISIVTAHLNLLAPGGIALIAVPNYSGIYLKLQSWCDEENLQIHNIKIMSVSRMNKLIAPSTNFTSKVYYFGRFTPGLISLTKKFGAFGKVLHWILNFVAHLQFAHIKQLCPLLVLEVKRIT